MIWRWGRDDGPDAPDRGAAPPTPDDERSDPGTGTAPSGEPPDEPAAPTTHQVGAVAPGDLATAVRRTVTRALAEDLGDHGDLTSLACVPPTASGTAHAIAREPGTIAGTAAFVEAFAQVDPRVEVELRVADGDRVDAGDVVAEVRGRLRSVLTAERTALNLLGRLSGVATTTRAFVAAVEGTGCAVRDTRKTTPGMRLLEKAAVTAGGGTNHRVGLHDALLVKDNHVAAAGGVGPATRAALERAGDRPVQVEVTGIDGLEQAIAAGATDVLADNLDPDALNRLVTRASGRAAVEASGGITLQNVRAYAETGVDRVAVGALTHSARTLDIALDVVAGDDPSGGPGDRDVPEREPELFGDGADARRPEA